MDKFNTTVESLFQGMDNFLTTKTVVGEAVHIDDTIILPLVDVTFGVAAGAHINGEKNSGAGGIGGKITPSAVLIIQNGHSKLVSVKNQDSWTKLIDMIPDVLDRIESYFAGDEETKTEDDIVE